MEDLRNEFPALKNCLYLNTASAGLLSKTLYKWRNKEEQNYLQHGAKYNERQLNIEKARISVARFFNAQVNEVALVPNFSYGWNSLLEGLPQGQKVLLLQNDYPSLLWPIEIRDFNVCYVTICEQLETAITEAFKKHRPDIFVFSIVQWLSGIKLDLHFLTELKAQYPDVLFMADATQHMGTEPFNFNNSAIDVLGGSGYKWMLAGFGNGVLLVKKAVQHKIFPQIIGFNSATNFNSKATDTTFIKHFEPGHQDTLNYGSLHQAIVQAEKILMQNIKDQLHKISVYAKEQFSALHLLDPAVKNRNIHSSIFNLNVSEEVYRKLALNNIICSQRGGGIRVSFHYYNTIKEVDELVSHLQP